MFVCGCFALGFIKWSVLSALIWALSSMKSMLQAWMDIPWVRLVILAGNASLVPVKFDQVLLYLNGSVYTGSSFPGGIGRAKCQRICFKIKCLWLLQYQQIIYQLAAKSSSIPVHTRQSFVQEVIRCLRENRVCFQGLCRKNHKVGLLVDWYRTDVQLRWKSEVGNPLACGCWCSCETLHICF